MHEQGYQYVGPSSLYKLTLPEMMRLHIGWEYRQRQQSEGQAVADAHASGMDLDATPTNEVGGHGQQQPQAQTQAQTQQPRQQQAQQRAAGLSAKARAKAANPHRKPPGQPRQSDLDMLDRISNQREPDNSGQSGGGSR